MTMNVNLQHPTSNIQRNLKLQIPSTNRPSRDSVFVAWSFCGAWKLEVGGSAARLLMSWCIFVISVTLNPLSAADAKRGIVASVHPAATQAGLNVLKHGGNAVDATVAVALTLGVVDSDNSGIGGGCFILIHR